MKRTVIAGFIIVVVSVSALVVDYSLKSNRGPISPVSTPPSLYTVNLSVLNPQVTEVSGYNNFYNNITQGSSLQVNMSLTSRTNQPATVPIKNLTISYYNSTVDLHKWINDERNYSGLQQ
jgi:hypothetical protein